MTEITKPLNLDETQQRIATACETMATQTTLIGQGKADKVSNPTSGNFAGLDGNGNLTDTGKKPSDYNTKTEAAAQYYNKTEVNSIKSALEDEDRNLQHSITALAANMSYAIDSIISNFTLEANSSPTFTVNNPGAAAHYIDHMGGYVLLQKTGGAFAAKLDPADWGKFADGTTVSAAMKAAGEFMIHVPDCHYLGSSKTLQFGGMTPVEDGHVFGSPNWVGAYQMSAGGHSRPGVGSHHSITMTAFWQLAQAIGTDWGLANYQFHCLINALYQARYGNLNSEVLLSNNHERSSAEWTAYRDLAHGRADSLGDGTGCVSAVDSKNVTRYVTKLFGFEDLFGKLWEFRPGIRYYMDVDVRHAVVYEGNQVSNTATGRDISGVLSSASGQYATQMHLGEYWDMICQAVGGGDTTYYCDGYWAATAGELLLVGGCADYGSRCGLSYSFSNGGFGGARDVIGARLAFYGQPEIVSGQELQGMLA